MIFKKRRKNLRNKGNLKIIRIKKQLSNKWDLKKNCIEEGEMKIDKIIVK